MVVKIKKKKVRESVSKKENLNLKNVKTVKNKNIRINST